LAYVEFLEGKPTIPIVSITRHEISTLRPETGFLLGLAGIAEDSLICIDDPLMPLKADVTLVDHNRLNLRSTPENLEWSVVEIVDHHADEGAYKDTVAGSNRTIAFEGGQASVASCTTLVGERFLRQHAPGSSIPISFATLIYGVILLDSVNMSEQAGKATTRDQTVLDALVSGTDWSSLQISSPDLFGCDGLPNATAWFDILQNQKFDSRFWAKLDVKDALSLDYKSFEASEGKTFGVSTVLQSMDDFFSKENAAQKCLDFIQANDILMLCVMFAVSDAKGRLTRQLAMVGPTSIVNSMVSFLQTEKTEFQLTLNFEREVDEKNFLVGLDQANVAKSRKQVAPSMMDFWEDGDVTT
jgi:exopolyphosphatase